MDDLRKLKLQYTLEYKLNIDPTKPLPLLFEGFKKQTWTSIGEMPIEYEEDDVWDMMFENSDNHSEFKILLASYWDQGYSGFCWILIQQKHSKQLYEVENSRCSCHGIQLKGERYFSHFRATNIDYLKSDYFDQKIRNEFNELLKGPEWDKEPIIFSDLIDYVVEQ